MCLADISIIFAPKIEKKGRKTMRLSELNTGEKGVIVKVLGHGGFRKRIVEMGFIKGKTVEVLLNAPLRDPIKYKVMGYEISLRRQEAEMIEIISEQEAKEQAVQPDYHEGLGENMHLGEDELKQLALGKRRTINVALVGNPNCGKTSLFNIASGSHEHVGNYSGVTVDAKEGILTSRAITSVLSTFPEPIPSRPTPLKKSMFVGTSSMKRRISLSMLWTLPIWNAIFISPPS